MKERFVFRTAKLLVATTLPLLLLGSAFAFKGLLNTPACAIALTKQNVFYNRFQVAFIF